MYKNRFLLVLGVLSLLLVSMVVSSSRFTASSSNVEAASDFHQRHPGWMWVVSQEAIVPITGDPSYPDYYHRHRSDSSVANPLDTTDYFFRHPELSGISPKGDDMTDYYFRHPELSTVSARAVDLTDYYFRHAAD